MLIDLCDILLLIKSPYWKWLPVQALCYCLLIWYEASTDTKFYFSNGEASLKFKKSFKNPTNTQELY